MNFTEYWVSHRRLLFSDGWYATTTIHFGRTSKYAGGGRDYRVFGAGRARRLNASGYPATLAVENVSAGYHTLAEAFSGWRDSPPHRANMLKNGVTKLGIAASYAPNTKYKVFWTLILASSETE